MGADFSDRRCTCPDKRVDIISRRCRVGVFVHFFLCSNQIQYPIRESVTFYRIEKSRELDMGMRVDQSWHQKGIFQVDCVPVRKLLRDCAQRANSTYDPFAYDNSAIVKQG